MGRKKINDEQMMARFQDGTLDRIDQVLEEGETKADFVRDAVEAKIKRRERKK